VLGIQFLIDHAKFGGQMVKRVGLSVIRGFDPVVSFGAPKLFNLAHCAMHGAQLVLHLCEQVQLINDQRFSLTVKGCALIWIVWRHTPNFKLVS
jgi:hypothetical protein